MSSCGKILDMVEQGHGGSKKEPISLSDFRKRKDKQKMNDFLDSLDQLKIANLMFGGMSRQEAEAKVRRERKK